MMAKAKTDPAREAVLKRDNTRLWRDVLKEKLAEAEADYVNAEAEIYRIEREEANRK